MTKEAIVLELEDMLSSKCGEAILIHREFAESILEELKKLNTINITFEPSNNAHGQTCVTHNDIGQVTEISTSDNVRITTSNEGEVKLFNV